MPADPFSNPDSRFVVQPAETSADTIQVTARTATDVVVSAASGAMFVAGASGAACLARNYITVVINGVTYYVPASTTTW